MPLPPCARPDAAAHARALGCSREAVELLYAGPFVDLHNDLEVPVRVFGYDATRHHGIARGVRPLVGHTDYPRLREAAFTGVVCDVATNPLRPAGNRLRTTLANVDRVKARVEAHPEHFVLARTAADHDRAVASGRTAMWLALQGGNALSADPGALDGPLGQDLLRITLVHLTTSDLGSTSSLGARDQGLTDRGRELIAACRRNRVLVDLAHAGRATFWDALEAHGDGAPPIVSHAGADAVRRHWRNVDDAQIRAIADRGGVIGVMYQSSFLDDVSWSCARSKVADHLDHLVRIGGDAVAAIGTDYDGFVIPPRDLSDPTHHPLLVQDLLDRGWSADRIRGVLGANFLRVVREVRP